MVAEIANEALLLGHLPQRFLERSPASMQPRAYGANLYRSMLISTDLRGVNLTDADLTGTIFLDIDFAGANLTRACLAHTFFADCRGLHETVGLAEIRHRGPSYLDVQTLRASIVLLPDAFLQEVGYRPDEIAALRTIYTTPAR